MNLKAEVREFFLRNNQVREGALRDRDVNYPITHFVNKYFIENGISEIRKIEVGNRFLKGNVPSDEMYEKLFKSIVFKENIDDIASTTTPGLVKIATDSQLASGLEKDEKGIILVTTAKQLANKANTIITGPSEQGSFSDNPTIWYVINTKVINKLLYVKVTITAKANETGTKQTTLNFSSISLNQNVANTIVSDGTFHIHCNALQSNNTILVTLMKRNAVASVNTATINFESGWRLVL